jgi:hypothetical protein
MKTNNESILILKSDDYKCKLEIKEPEIHPKRYGELYISGFFYVDDLEEITKQIKSWYDGMYPPESAFTENETDFNKKEL